MNIHWLKLAGHVSRAAVTGLAVALIATPGWCQVPGARLKAKAEGAAEAAKDEAAKAKGTAKEVADEARDAAKQPREAVKGARDKAKGAVEGAREGAREGAKGAREAAKGAREAGREARDTRRDISSENLRAADLGLWLNARAGSGLVVADVAAEGAIAKVGFREGDRIVSVHGTPVKSEAEFMRLLLADDIRDQRVEVVVIRDGREQIVYVQPAMIFEEVVAYDPLWHYGIVLDDRYPDRIVVLRVYPRTPAYYAGLRAGDVIISLGGQRIATSQDFVRAFSRADGQLALQVNRSNRTRDLEIDTSASVQGNARTTLKPQVEAEGRTEGRAKVEADKPADSKSKREKPADEKPRLEKPRTEKPAAEKPSAEKPRIEKPDAPATPAPKAPSTPKTPSLPKP